MPTPFQVRKPSCDALRPFASVVRLTPLLLTIAEFVLALTELYMAGSRSDTVTVYPLLSRRF